MSEPQGPRMLDPIPPDYQSARDIAERAGVKVPYLLESGPDGPSQFAHDAGLEWVYDKFYESWCSAADAEKALDYIANRGESE